MDETLAVAAIDLGGRPHAVVDTGVRARLVGDLQSELVADFFLGFALGARANVHVRVLYGRSSHHRVEASFKAFGARPAHRVRPRSAAGARAAEHEGVAVIALVDYGAGNLASVRKALRACGADAVEPAEPADLERAAAIVLPGVGHFAATASLDHEWRTAVRRRLDAGVPFLGICLGMQWLFEGSDEAPAAPGLGGSRAVSLASRSARRRASG